MQRSLSAPAVPAATPLARARVRGSPSSGSGTWPDAIRTSSREASSSPPRGDAPPLPPPPAVVLLHAEPFSNLDADLRAQMRADVEKVLRATRTTAIFV